MTARMRGCVVASGVLMLAAGVLSAQTAGAGQSNAPAAPATNPAPAAAPAQVPKQAPPAMPGWMMPAPHQNAPLGKFERFPGDGDGATRPATTATVSPSRGTRRPRPTPKSRGPFSSFFTATGRKSGSILRPEPTRTGRWPT